MRVLYVVEMELTQFDCRADAASRRQYKLLLINIMEAPLLEDRSVVGAHPPASLFSNRPFKVLYYVLCEAVFSFMVLIWQGRCTEVFDETIHEHRETVVFRYVLKCVVVPRQFPIRGDMAQRPKHQVV